MAEEFVWVRGSENDGVGGNAIETKGIPYRIAGTLTNLDDLWVSISMQTVII